MYALDQTSTLTRSPSLEAQTPLAGYIRTPTETRVKTLPGQNVLTISTFSVMVLFHERLREARRALGLTQDAAAKRAGITQTQWARYERGAEKPRPDRQRQISQAVELDPETLEPLLVATGQLQLPGSHAIAWEVRRNPGRRNVPEIWFFDIPISSPHIEVMALWMINHEPAVIAAFGPDPAFAYLSARLQDLEGVDPDYSPMTDKKMTRHGKSIQQLNSEYTALLIKNRNSAGQFLETHLELLEAMKKTEPAATKQNLLVLRRLLTELEGTAVQ